MLNLPAVTFVQNNLTGLCKEYFEVSAGGVETPLFNELLAMCPIKERRFAQMLVYVEAIQFVANQSTSSTL